MLDQLRYGSTWCEKIEYTPWNVVQMNDIKFCVFETGWEFGFRHSKAFGENRIHAIRFKSGKNFNFEKGDRLMYFYSHKTLIRFNCYRPKKEQVQNVAIKFILFVN